MLLNSTTLLSTKAYFLLVHIIIFSSNILASNKIVIDSEDKLIIALNKAKPGDTLQLAAGHLEIKNSIVVSNNINLIGQGIDRTILSFKKPTSQPIIIYKANNNFSHSFSISNMSLIGHGSKAFRNGNFNILDSGIDIHGKALDFKISKIKFMGFSLAAINVYSFKENSSGHARGIIHNCEFIDNIYVSEKAAYGYGVAVYGDDKDIRTYFGNENAVYVENNYFERCRHAITSNAAARYVFRYNTINNNYAPFAAIDTHGKSGRKKGTRSFEIYENIIAGGIHWDSGNIQKTWAIGIRGGDGVIFNNIVVDNELLFIIIEDYMRSKQYPYPIKDQTRQLYIWNNSINGFAKQQVNLGWSKKMEPTLKKYFQQDRDYFLYKKPNYQPLSYPHPSSN